MSWKILALSAAVGMSFLTADARAMPLTHELKAAVNEDVIAVRDGCGRGWRWSNRRGGCVPMDAGPPPGPRVDPAAAAAAAVTLGVVGAIVGSGPRHHHRPHHRPHRHHRR